MSSNLCRDDKHQKHDSDGRDMPNIDKQNGDRREPGERSFYNEVRFFKWSKDNVAVSLRARSASYGGSEVLIVQKTSGTLNAGAHPGSYNGQDAYNDLLVVENGNNNNEPQRLSHESGGERSSGFTSDDRLQRPADSYENYRGVVQWMSSRAL